MTPFNYYMEDNNQINNFNLSEHVLDNNVLFFGASPLDLMINFPDMIYRQLNVDQFQNKHPLNSSLISLFI